MFAPRCTIIGGTIWVGIAAEWNVAIVIAFIMIVVIVTEMSVSIATAYIMIVVIATEMSVAIATAYIILKATETIVVMISKLKVVMG